MTTRIHVVVDGNDIGTLSEMTLAALRDSGLLNRQDTPAQTLSPAIQSPCIECDKHPRTIGIFCGCCFVRLRDHESGWARAWYGPSWDEAVKLAERVEVAL